MFDKTHRNEHLESAGEIAIAKSTEVLARAALIHTETSPADRFHVGTAQQRARRILRAGRAARHQIAAHDETADGSVELQSPVVDGVGGGRRREAAVGAGGGEGR